MACGPEKFRYQDDLMLDETGEATSILLLWLIPTPQEQRNLFSLTGLPKQNILTCLAALVRNQKWVWSMQENRNVALRLHCNG